MILALWLPSIATGLLVVIFLWRRLWRDLPFFFTYLVYALLVAGLRYVAYLASKHFYFYVYFISDWTGAVIVFLAIYEVFLRRVFTKFYKTRFYRQIFPLFAIAILILALTTALLAHDRRAAFLLASRSFDFMRTAVLVFFIGLMVLMGRGWRRYDLGITLGFAIQAAVALANGAVKLQMHYRPTILDTVELAAYNISCLIWLITFSKAQEGETVQPNQLDRDALHQARIWESMLKTWLISGKSKR